MLFFWGRKLTHRKLGYVADFCPVCAGITANELQRVGSVVHVYYIGFGQGQLLGYKRTCLVCKTAAWVDRHRYASVAKTMPAVVHELIPQTFPNIETVEAERLALEAKTKKEPLRLSPAERHEVMRNAFLAHAPTVQNRFVETHIDLHVAATLIAAIALAVGGFYLQITYFPTASIEPTLFAMVAGVLALLIWQGSQVGRRFLRRKVIPPISATLRPLRPRAEEIQAVLTAFKQEGHTIGAKLRLDDLLKALHTDNAVQGGATVYVGSQQPIVVAPSPRKHLNTLFGLLILGAMGYVVWPFIFGADPMKAFCSEQSPGHTYEQVKANVAKRGYRISSLTEGGAFVYDEKSMARFNCNLRFGGSGLESAEFGLND